MALRVRTLARIVPTVVVVVTVLVATTLGNPPVGGVDEVRIGAAVVVGHGAALGAERPVYTQAVELRASYPVEQGVLGTPVADPLHEDLWSTVTHVLGEQWTDRISQFVLVEERPAHLVAVVHRSRADEQRWILTLDLADAGSSSLVTETLVHELAHLATLGPGDFTFGRGRCDGAALELGCAHDGSVLARFARLFWSGLDEPARGTSDAFVSTYASTAVQEDLAESFLAYVLGPPPPHGTTAAEKVEFFDEVPELAALARSVRARVG